MNKIKQLLNFVVRAIAFIMIISGIFGLFYSETFISGIFSCLVGLLLFFSYKKKKKEDRTKNKNTTDSINDLNNQSDDSKEIVQEDNIAINNAVIIHEIYANYFKNLMNAVGGKLYLYSDRLLFKSHKFNFQKHTETIFLSKIIKIEESCAFFNYKIRIISENNKTDTFVVYKSDWDKISKDIKDKISDDSKDKDITDDISENKNSSELMQENNILANSSVSSDGNYTKDFNEISKDIKKLTAEFNELQPNLELDAIRMDYEWCLQEKNYEGALYNISEFIKRVPTEYPDAYSERAKVRLFLMDVYENYSDMQAWHEVFSDLNTSNDIEQGNDYMVPILFGAINRLNEDLPHETPEEVENLINEVAKPIPQNSLFAEVIKALYYTNISSMDYGISIKDNLNKIIDNEPTIQFYRYARCYFFMMWLISYTLYVSISNQDNEIIDEEFIKNIREDINIISEIDLYKDVAEKINNYLKVLIQQYCKKVVEHLNMYLKILEILEQHNIDMEYHLAHWQDGAESDGYDLSKNIVETVKHDTENANISFIIDSENSYSQVIMGFIKFIYGKNTDALELLNKALEISNDNIYGYIIRGIVYKALGQYDNAMKDFELVISSDTKDINKDLISHQIKLIEEEIQHQQVYQDVNNTKKGRELDI